MHSLQQIFQFKMNEFGITEFLVSVLFSLFAGTLLLFLYRIYFYKTMDRNESLAKSFVLLAPAISAIFWAIQYSLPLSLGLLGALSFVRFRTPIKRAEDIGFILIVIAVSLLSSVSRFTAATLLIMIVFAIIAIKSFLEEKKWPFILNRNSLSLFISTNATDLEKIDQTIRTALTAPGQMLKTQNIILNDIIPQESGYNLRYSIYSASADDKVAPQLITRLQQIKELERVELFRPESV